MQGCQFNQARAALAAGEIETALEIWSRITAGTPDPDRLLDHAALLMELYRINDAEHQLERLRNHADARPGQLLSGAKLLFQIGRFAAAARLTAAATAIDRENSDIAAMLAAMLERSGEVAQASALLVETLTRHPGHARTTQQLSHIERRRGDFEQARSRLVAHLSNYTSEDDWRLNYELAGVLDRLGDYPAAFDALRAAKRQLEPSSRVHRPRWRAIADRQWQVAQGLERDRLQAWQQSARMLQPPLRLCLVAGFPRSGTTLLEQILTTHPCCVGTDETGILATQFRNPLVFQASSAAEALRELDSFEVDDLENGRAEYLRCTAEYIGEPLGSRLLIEKEPLLTADLAVPLRLFPEAKILMPLRDPRDVVISFFFTIVPLAPHSAAAATLEDTCLYYAEVMRHWLLLRDRLDPSRWFESRYEDLLAEPEAHTRRVAAFLDLEWSPDMLSHHKQSSVREVSTPTYDDVSKPLYTRSRGRWNNYRTWLEPHLHLLEPFIKAFGYE